MNKSKRFPSEVKERAVRLVNEHRDQYESQWAALISIAGKIGCSPETLRQWVLKSERDQNPNHRAKGLDAEYLKTLERENRELKRANEILRKAAAFFAQAELDRRVK